jgi:hypothetical protein
MVHYSINSSKPAPVAKVLPLRDSSFSSAFLHDRHDITS